MKSVLKQCMVVGSFVSSLVGAVVAQAQTAYPNKLINMIVAFPVGGPSDVIARVVAKPLGDQLGQNLIVENVGGVAGSLGAQKAANAAPDGHTLLAGSPLELIYTPMGIAAAKNKPEDMRMAGLIGRTTMVIVVKADLPVKTMAELVDYAKKASKPLSFGSTGIGSLYHLMGEHAMQIAGAKGLHVPYNGLAPYLQDLMGGNLDWGVLPVAGPVPGAIEGGKIRALAVTNAEPVARLPKVPLIKETAGFKDYAYSIWIGVQTGRRVSDAVVTTINTAFNTVMAKPEVRKAVEATGTIVAGPMTVSQLDAFYKAEIAAGASIAKAVNLQPQ
jgi:tripartite-type tricarboxylate transporter receptor subunit TctC